MSFWISVAALNPRLASNAPDGKSWGSAIQRLSYEPGCGSAPPPLRRESSRKAGLRRRVVGVAVLLLGLLFVGLVSAADLRGLDTSGTAAPDILAHWRDGLGWGFTPAVALTLALSLAGMVLLLTNIRFGISRRAP